MENIGWFIIIFILWILRHEDAVALILRACRFEEETTETINETVLEYANKMEV